MKNSHGGGAQVFDSHVGSGSSRIAAYYAGLDFYGCEISKDYFESMEKRFQKKCLGIEKYGNITIIEPTLF